MSRSQALSQVKDGRSWAGSDSQGGERVTQHDQVHAMDLPGTEGDPTRPSAAAWSSRSCAVCIGHIMIIEYWPQSAWPGHTPLESNEEQNIDYRVLRTFSMFKTIEL